MYNLVSGEYDIYIICIISAFVLALVAGPVFIPVLTRMKFGQIVRDDGPQSHLKKTGTPAMGGIIIAVPAVIVSLAFSKDKDMLLVLITTMLFGIIGFIDDFLKIKNRRSLGLRAYQKIILQLLVSVFMAFVASGISQVGTEVLIPFTGKFIDLGILYIPFTVLVLISTVNCVNLTDGLDGLAGGTTVVVLGFFSVIALASKNTGLLVFAGAMIGALLGFLRFNSHPAQVFMGDTGSLALGGAIAALAVITRLPLFILIIGAIYVLEGLSVIIQVAYFKMTGGKRFFKMAPLHHHFELSGWAESKIVAVFIIASIILSLIGILGLS
ncbi:MAG TPA: phospho-N-acetylmuramoyl-pentapeptide-transferase [Bacillota bacterium]|jgi:phospho-N-acetylmuramoyl-pentapeptide-transferase|nr:phospho-N-acetylmuramoyl-pentapeptide-transferase [Bacillota bacterium]HQI16756.1 phospho-N-acetylmuramoyl-pentapeptide-transferase [Bacillota bacterium]HQJ37823.1 phospho-N-acetylmuramoyl-pentapeptide-transferase [Bacillota bacterium]HQL37493.1 phospho-N-acetylmuramoyl-pentapeptide-transferase [Bacillota bacterium]